MKKRPSIVLKLVVFLFVIATALTAGPSLSGKLTPPVAEAADPAITLSSSGWSLAGVGTWDSATSTGTLTRNVTGPITISGDNITLDGAGHTLTGPASGNGVDISNRTGVTVKNLTITNWTNGIYMVGSTNPMSTNTISGNTITSNSDGIYMKGSSFAVSANTISGNTITNNSNGIRAYTATSNTITRNTLQSNGTAGLYFEYTSTGNSVYNNNFLSNTDQVFLSTSCTGNVFYQPLPVGGNYWSDKTGSDGNGDGIFDTAYTVQSSSPSSSDAYPWVAQDGWAVDSIPPTTTIGLAGTSGSDGWYRSSVTVTLTAEDDSGGSGVQKIEYSTNSGSTWSTYSSPFTIASEGTTTLLARATDNNGNVESPDKSQDVKIDTIAPTISGEATTAPNSNGWYRGDVIICWTVTDTVSGAIAPEDTIVTGEGNDLTAGPVTVTDAAGNTSASASVTGIRIDRTPPEISGAETSEPNENGWYKEDVVVHFDASDAVSGIDTITPDATLSTEGTDQEVMGTATDLAGNTADFTVSGVNIDKTGPVVETGRTPDANENGWNNCSVTASFTATDDLSGLDGVGTAEESFTIDGANQSASRVFTDLAGNQTMGEVTDVNIDTVAPTIDGGAMTEPNGNGWYKDDVVVHFEGVDVLSGIDAVTPDQTLNAEGAGQSVEGVAVDKAGNSASFTADSINIDKTAPEVFTTRTPANDNGWNNMDVDGTISATDSLSGISGDSSVDVKFTAEAAGQSQSHVFADLAGNEAMGSITDVNIDKTPPVVESSTSPDANGAGWNNTTVTATFEASDGLSGVDGPAVLTADLSSEGAGQSASRDFTDKAGNKATGAASGINIDLTAPALEFGAASPEANAAGWNNTDVSVPYTTGDNLSGVAETSVASPLVLSEEGTAVTGSVTVTDAAGNSETFTTSPFKIDKTGPKINASRDVEANANGWNNTDVTVTFDATPGIAPIKSVTGPITVSDEGAGQLVKGTAVDEAGNTASVTVDDINIDKTPPEVSGAATTGPNENGWYKDEVVVHFDASDTRSGIDTVSPDATVGTEGADQEVKGTAIDLAGNTAEFAVSGINIDMTGPVVVTSRTPDANENGWNKCSVTASFTATDDLSGLDGVGTAEESFTLDGANQSASRVFTDCAGNQTMGEVTNVNIDTVAPTIDGGATTDPNGNGWYKDDVVVHFEGEEIGGSGVDTVTPDTTISTEGADQWVEGTVTDKAGNMASMKVSGISIDKTAPEVTFGTPDPAANENGWNNTDVAIPFTILDDLSDVASSDPDADSLVLSAEGNAVTGSVTVTDRAGNTDTFESPAVKIDKTKPTTEAASDASGNPSPGPVTITLSASDNPGGSGVARTEYSYYGDIWDTYTAPLVVTSEGATTIYYRSTDNAGNVEVDKTISINISNEDKTPPVTTAICNPDTAWTNGPVTVTLSAEDNPGGAGVARTQYSFDGGKTWNRYKAPFVVSAVGVTTVSFRSTDSAGNVEAAKTVNVQIEKGLPVVGASKDPKPNTSGWNGADVTVKLTASDSRSGVEEIHYRVGTGPETVVAGSEAILMISNEGRTVVKYWAVDSAGNAAAKQSLTVKLDKTSPVVTFGAPSPAPNGAGWNKTNVKIPFTTQDDLSGVAGTSPLASPLKLTTEGSAVTGTVTVVDAAGNSATYTSPAVKIDKSAPTITFNEPANGAVYQLHEKVAADWDCSDGVSGVSVVTATTPYGSDINTDSIGKKTFKVTATDNAGNTISKTVTYKVVYAIHTLYDQASPVRRGSTIAIKLQLWDALGANVSSAKVALNRLGVNRVGGGTASPSGNFHFDATLEGSGGYGWNINTKGLAKGTWVIKFTAGTDPMVYKVQFVVN